MNGKLHKIYYQGDYGLRVYAVRNGGYWWGVYPAPLLFPESDDYLEEGQAETQTTAWREGLDALSVWATGKGVMR